MAPARSHLPRIRRAHRREDGAALVELALVLPILIVLLFGAVDFGTAFNYWIDETHLANKTARWAAVDKNPSATDSLQEYVRQQANTAELADGLQVCIDFPSGSSQVGDPVRATVTYTYEFLPFLSGVLPGGDTLGNVPIESSATMRLEAPPNDYAAGCTSVGT